MFLRKMSSASKNVGVQLPAILNYLRSFAVPETAEKWDNVGLLLEPFTPTPVKNVLMTIDLTEDVVAEAIKEQAQLIISYHPPIFSGIKNINNSTWKGRIVSACLENKIAVFSPHTCWDNAEGGVNDWLLLPFKLQGVGKCASECGRSGTLSEEITLRESIERIRNFTKAGHVRLALARNASLDDRVKRIAVCAGSGASVLKGTAADLYITGEMSHHETLDAIHNGSSVVLLEHSSSERGFLSYYAPKIGASFPDINVVVSKADKEPLTII